MKNNDLSEFTAGHKERGAGYTYFVPKEVNKEWIWRDSLLNQLLERASRKLGELNSFARLVPSIDLFIHMHVTKEAVLSSRIEGTQTYMEEAVLPKDEIAPERRNDWQEVQNYTNAMNWAINHLNTIPLSTRLLKQVHSMLMKNARGAHKQPGEFRSSQNWIGGATISDAVFIPPAHTHVNSLMGDLENFLHSDEIHTPTLIRAGIAHYQFETIHPFLDGNGRIGRLLIGLYLVNEKVLDRPLLYISAFFEKNKSLYYDNLTRVREKNDIVHWLKYFLVGIEATASQGITTLTRILALKEEIEQTIRKHYGRRTQSAVALLQSLFNNPVVSIKDAGNICNLSKKTAGELVSLFAERHWLKEITGLSRGRIFVFEPYLNLFD